MEKMAINLDDVLRAYMLSSYVPSMGEEIDQLLPADALGDISSEMYAAQFLSSFYEKADDYTKLMKSVKSHPKLGSLEKVVQEQISGAQDTFVNYLNRNESVLERLSLVAKKRGVDKLTVEDKYSAIRDEFKDVQEYLVHVQQGLNAYLQNIFYTSQAMFESGSEEFEYNMFLATKLVTKYSELLLNEAESIYNVKFKYNTEKADDYDASMSKAA